MHAPLDTAHDHPVVRLAEVLIGAVRVGIPADAVVHALAAPAAPVLLPRRQGALRGVLDYDGMLVPVVDLARWVDVGSAPPDPARHGVRDLILRAGGRVIGLQVDGVGGLHDIAAADVTRLHHDDGAEEVFHSAARAPDGGRILSLLDVDRLATLAAAWSEHGAVTPAPAAPIEDIVQATLPYALLRAGTRRLGVAAGDLTEVIPMPALERFGGGLGGAYCTWRGRHLPLSDLLASDGAGASRLLAVLEHGGLALGIPVDAALQLGAFAAPDADAVTTTVYDADGAVELVGTQALFARSPEAALSKRDGAARPHAAGPDKLGAANEVACIVFEADGLGAAPIDCVDQVLALTGPGDATMDWGGNAIPVVDLRPPGSRAGAGHVLVVRGHDDARVACVVTRVHLLIPAGSARQYRLGVAGGAPVDFITTGDGAERASYRMVDLAARARPGLAA